VCQCVNFVCVHVFVSVCTFITASQVRGATAQIHVDKKTQVYERIKKSTYPCSIAVDGWTNIRKDKVTNIVVLCDSVAYYLKSVTNVTETNDATWLFEHIEPIFAELIAFGIKIVAIAADNEYLNGAFIRMLQVPYPFLVHVPCAAHTLQLIVNKIMKLDMFRSCVQSILDIVHHFDRKKANRLKLKQLQEQDGMVYCIVRPNDTRWSSLLACINRMLQLQRYIQFILPQYQSIWSTLSDLANFLKPFQIATDVVQSDAATLFDVYTVFHDISTHIKSMKKHNVLQHAYKQAATIFNREWRNNINIDATVASAMLSFRDISQFSIEQKKSVKKFIISFGSEYLSKYYNDKGDSTDTIQSTLLRQLSNFRGKKGEFSDSIAEFTMLQGKDTKRDCREFWDLNIDTAPELSIVAIAILSIVASEASVERTFSAQGSVHSKQRNRLLDSRVEAEMFIKFNNTALNKSYKDIKFNNITELTDNEEETECSEPLELLFSDSDSGSDSGSDVDEASDTDTVMMESDDVSEHKSLPNSPLAGTI
jgi:hypothetical protein